MTGLPDALSPKLAKLLPLLGSDKDGEVVATARAIGRTLVSAGCDLHDLAEAATRPMPPPRIINRDRSAPSAEPPCSYSRSRDPDGRRDLARANRLLLAVERLSLKEQSFLINVRQILLGGRPLSPKQSDWLADIHARAGREFA